MRDMIKVILVKEPMGYESVPWSKSEDWKIGFWYPMPQGSMWTNPDKCAVIDSYGIFMLDPKIKKGQPLFGDITTISHLMLELTFQEAVAICEAHNKFSWELEDKE